MAAITLQVAMVMVGLSLDRAMHGAVCAWPGVRQCSHLVTRVGNKIMCKGASNGKGVAHFFLSWTALPAHACLAPCMQCIHLHILDKRK